MSSIEIERARRAALKQAKPAEVNRAAADATDIDTIFDEYLDSVYRFIFRQVGNRQDAEDLTSEVFLSATKNLDVGRPRNAIGRWLFTVTRTVIADHWRKYYRVPPLVDIDSLQLAELAPVSGNDDREGVKSRLIARVLDGLPGRYREVLELRFLKGHTLAETATAMGITVENVKITQHRALAKAVQIADQLT